MHEIAYCTVDVVTFSDNLRTNYCISAETPQNIFFGLFFLIRWIYRPLEVEYYKLFIDVHPYTEVELHFLIQYIKIRTFSYAEHVSKTVHATYLKKLGAV